MAYGLLTKLLFESNNPEHLYAHTFLVLHWNIVSRIEYVVYTKTNLVLFKNDSLLFDMGPMKTDQNGTRNVDHPWHVYSCREYPEICAQLLLARLVMENTLILNGRTDFLRGRHNTTNSTPYSGEQ